ncbi:IS66 family insertion sequence element accessory protein TnpB [Comamonas sp. JC664]|uniref:IS66 family insertion sequence element accessory protein TnpB n=1 Tax=Comamonas sp. JC664 TaxID=2801917 RepID=UPI001889FED7|nr:IS66 family insertion sequence element accessory protein TnpB [Comamonas sp. JC664]
MRVLVAIEPVDFRQGVDGLARQCRAALSENPFSGAVFVFRNRQRTAVKLLVYDGQGFWLCPSASGLAAAPEGSFAPASFTLAPLLS